MKSLSQNRGRDFVFVKQKCNYIDNRLYFDTIFKRVSTTMDINLFLALTLTDIV